MSLTLTTKKEGALRWVVYLSVEGMAVAMPLVVVADIRDLSFSVECPPGPTGEVVPNVVDFGVIQS